MQEVDSHPFLAGHTFPGKDIIHLLCIAEEVMRRGIVIRVNRSDDTNFTVVGVDFYVRALFTSVAGWTANCVVCQKDSDLLIIPPRD